MVLDVVLPDIIFLYETDLSAFALAFASASEASKLIRIERIERIEPIERIVQDIDWVDWVDWADWVGIVDRSDHLRVPKETGGGELMI